MFLPANGAVYSMPIVHVYRAEMSSVFFVTHMSMHSLGYPKVSVITVTLTQLTVFSYWTRNFPCCGVKNVTNEHSMTFEPHVHALH